MKSNEQNTRAIASLDWGLSFSFPTLEGLVAVFLLISVWLCMVSQLHDPHIVIRPGPDFNSTEVSEYILNRLESEASTSLLTILTLSEFVLALAIPMLIAFSLAATLESGLLETLLSYPISRKTLLLTRTGIVTIVTSGSVILTSSLSVGVFFLWRISVTDLLLLTVGLCSMALVITTSAILLAVISKRVGITSAGGGALWLGLLYVTSFPQENFVWDWVLNPIQLIVRYLTGREPLVGVVQVFMGILGNAILGLSLLVLCVLVFERIDV
jgi:hypothetical protein